MAKLLQVSIPIHAESAAVGSPVIVEYPRAYVTAAGAAGGQKRGQIGSVTGGMANLLNAAGNGPLLVYGGEEGDPVPPVVTLRIKPRGDKVQGVDWTVSGHPRDTGGGKWDGSAIGGTSDVIATAQQVGNLTDLLAAGAQQQTDVAAAIAGAASAGAQAKQTADTAAAQAVDLGTQALEQANTHRIPSADIPYVTLPDNTWAYTPDTRELFRWEAGHAVKRGEGAASAVELTKTQGAVQTGLQIALRNTLTNTPRQPGEIRRLADGHPWEWRATGTPDAGRQGDPAGTFGTCLAHSEGGFWHRQFEVRSLEFYGARAIQEGDEPFDSYPAFAAALAAAPWGTHLRGSDSDGTYYLGQTWMFNRDDVTLDIGNLLSPMPGFTDFLVFAHALPDNQKRWGVYNRGNPWQATFRTKRLLIHGRRRSRGLWVQGRDLYEIAGLQVRYCNGCAWRMDSMREGAAYSPHIYANMRGADSAVIQYMDTIPGTDANNTNRIFDPHWTHNIGTVFHQLTPHVGVNGSVSRLLDIYSGQLETIGPSQVHLAFGDMDPLPTVPTSEDIMKVENGDGFSWLEGHIFVDTLTLPAEGGVTRGGAVIRLGFDADTANSNPRKVTNATIRTKMFVANGDAGVVLLARHNCDDTEFDPTIIGPNIAQLEWVNGANGGGGHRRRTPMRFFGSALNGLVTLEAAPGQAASPSVEFKAGDKTGRLFYFPGLMVIQPDITKGVYHFFRDDGAQWVQGANGQIGIAGQGYKQMTMQSNNGLKQLQITVGDDGEWYVSNGTNVRRVQLV